MRIAWAAALLFLVGCSTTASQTAQAAPPTACTEPRPQVCTMQYAPACATLATGGFRTYASACSACADPAVVGTQDGPCRE